MKFLIPLCTAVCFLLIPVNVFSESVPKTIKIAPYGNSITQAAGDHDSYRYRLWKKLIDAEIPFDFVGSMNRNWNNVNRTVPDYKGQQFDKDHEGHWGWRADEILSKPGDNMGLWLNDYTPDMVLLHIGTNDCSQGNDVNSTISEIRQIIANLRDDNPEVVVFLSNLIPCSITDKIGEINGRIETLPAELTTEASPVIFVNQHSGFTAGGDQYDGIHPKETGEEKMAQKWFDAIDNYLNSLPEDTTLKIAPYGNSITQADGNHDSYRYPLWKKLVDAEIPFDFVGSMTTNFRDVDRDYADYNGKRFDRDHEGHWGWRADEILSKAGDNMGLWLDDYTPDMVLLHIGTNDCTQGDDINSTVEEIRQIIANLRSDNPEVVIFLSNLIPCGITDRIPAMNDNIETLPEELSTDTSPVIFVDQFSGIDINSDLQDDRIHPNASGEEKMALKWFEAIDKFLNPTGAEKRLSTGSIARHVNTTDHRVELIGLQSVSQKIAPASEKSAVTSLLGKKVPPSIETKRTSNGVYIISTDQVSK